MDEVDLNDGTADRYLLDAKGLSLVVFSSPDCGNCRMAQQQLPAMNLPVDRICWVDATENGGLVERYEVFHLPAMFVVRDAVYYGPVQATLAAWDISRQIALALHNVPAELP